MNLNKNIIIDVSNFNKILKNIYRKGKYFYILLVYGKYIILEIMKRSRMWNLTYICIYNKIKIEYT